MPKNNPQMHSLQQNKKSCVDDSCIFQLYSPHVCKDNNYASFTFVYQNGCFLYKTEIKHHHWILYISISLGTKFQLNGNSEFLDQVCTKRFFPV